MNAIGGALLHFLWQGSLIALLLAIVSWLARSARARYAAACTALLAMAAVFVTTAFLLWPAGTTPRVPNGSVRLATQEPMPQAPGESRISVSPFGIGISGQWLVILWMAGVTLLYSRSVAGWAIAQRHCRIGVRAPPPYWQSRLRDLAARMRVWRPVRLLESSLAETPVVIGFFRPVILMPLGVLTGYPSDQIEYILIHELAHVRRFDYVVNLMQCAVEGLLFFHPAVWWASSVVRREREHCCDDAVISMGCDKHEYAAALAALEEQRSGVALAASGGDLSRRIARLLGKPARTQPALIPLASLLLVPLAIAVAAWQPAPAPQPAVKLRATPPSPRPAAPMLIAQQAPVNPPRPRPAPQSQPPRIGDAYERWLNSEAVYIITDDERSRFAQLQSDQEAQDFIEAFWERRDPTPGTDENEFREEHYRRIAYANDHFGTTETAGWKTDRGRVYISYGPPDERSEYDPDAVRGFPRERWRYRFVEGVGDDLVLEFIAVSGTGEYTLIPPRTGPRLADMDQRAVVEIDPSGRAAISVRLADRPGLFHVYGRVTTSARRPVTMFEETVRNGGLYQRSFDLQPGSYRLNLVVKEVNTGAIGMSEAVFQVP